MIRHAYRVEPRTPAGYSVMLTVQIGGGAESAVEVASFADRIEANAKAIEFVTADRDRGIEAQVFQALQ